MNVHNALIFFFLFLFFSRHFVHPVGCFPLWRRSHKFTRFSSQSQTSSRKKRGREEAGRGEGSYIQTEAILDIVSLATASFVVDVNRSFDEVTDLLPRMHMPILLITEKEIFLRIRNAITEYVDLVFQQSSQIDENNIYCIPLPYASCRHYNRGERTVFYLLSSLITCPFLFFLIDFVGFLEALVHISVSVWVE